MRKLMSFQYQLLFLFSISSVYLTHPTPVSAFAIRDIFYNADVARNPGGPANLSNIYNPIIQTVFIAGGLVSLFSLLYGGFSYIMGAGQGDQKRVQLGREAITWSLWGLALLLCVYWIVQIIELVTGVDIINPNTTL